MYLVSLTEDQADKITLANLKDCIERKQAYIDENADAAVDGWLVEDIEDLYHLMHAYNYFCLPDEAYDV
jgi:hypothetical protein